MGILVRWDTDQKRIILQNYEQHWNWQEYQEAFRLTNQFAREVGYDIGVIADTVNMKTIPHNAVIYGSQAFLSLPSNIVLLVVVTHSNGIKTMVKIVSKVVRFKRAVIASTMDEARTLIAAVISRPGEGK